MTVGDTLNNVDNLHDFFFNTAWFTLGEGTSTRADVTEKEPPQSVKVS